MQNLFSFGPYSPIRVPHGQKRQKHQKLGKYVPKRELLVRYYQDLLSTGPRDIYNDNLTWSLAKHSPDLGQGAQKEPEWTQNDQQSQKRYTVSGSLCLTSFIEFELPLV